MAAPKAGVAQREHLKALATSSNAAVRAKAVAMLKSPGCPEEFAYLRDWLYQIYGRSGVGFGDVAPLSWQTVESWARITGNRPTADEVEMLMALDQTLRKAAAEAREKEKPTPTKPASQGKNGVSRGR
jgi:hypothetical protein